MTIVEQVLPKALLLVLICLISGTVKGQNGPCYNYNGQSTCKAQWGDFIPDANCGTTLQCDDDLWSPECIGAFVTELRFNDMDNNFWDNLARSQIRDANAQDLVAAPIREHDDRLCYTSYNCNEYCGWNSAVQAYVCTDDIWSMNEHYLYGWILDFLNPCRKNDGEWEL
jgi:hypothetical protein